MTNLLNMEISPKGQKELQEYLENFKKEMQEIAEKTIGEAYKNASFFIETDSIMNLGRAMLNGLKDYPKNKTSYDFKQIRAEIFREHKTEIIKDIESDLIAENERLKKQVDKLIEELDSFRF